VTAPVVPLRPAGDSPAAAREALAAVSRHLDRCKLAARTVRAYKRQSAAYADWLAAHAADHGDAFTDLVGAEGAVTAWKRDLITARSSPATVNQALAAVTLMYQQTGLRIAVKRVRIPRPGEPDALTRQQEAALRRAAARRGPRDAAIIAVLLDTGARVEECARLDAGDFAITARTGEVRLHGADTAHLGRTNPLAPEELDAVSGRCPVIAARIAAAVLPDWDSPRRVRELSASRLPGAHELAEIADRLRRAVAPALDLPHPAPEALRLAALAELIAPQTAGKRRCASPGCARELEAAPTGRRRVYCGPTCRQRARRSRLELAGTADDPS